MCNKEIRKEMKRRGVFQWQVGERLGVTEMTITRWLRTELPEEKKAAIRAAIADIVADREREDGDE